MGTLFLDQFTYLHFSSGILLYFWGVPIVPALILHTIFEFVENSNFGMNLINRWFPFWPGGKSYSDTFINSLGDTLALLLDGILHIFLIIMAQNTNILVATSSDHNAISI